MYARRSRYARRRRYPARKRRTRVARSYSRKRTSRRRYGGGRRFKKRVLSIASRKKYDTMRSGGTDGVIDVTFNDAQMAILAWSPTTIPYNQIEHAPAHRNSQEIFLSALKNASIHMPFSRSFGGVSCSGPTNDSSNSEPSRDWVVPDSDLALRTESQICRLSTSRS